MKTLRLLMAMGLMVWMLRPALAEVFNITVPTDTLEVSPGDPGDGAGDIAVEGEQDEYHFTLAEPGRFYLQEIFSGGNLEWRLIDPNGNETFWDWFDGYGLGRIDLWVTGDYQLIVRARVDQPAATGNYSFSISNLPPDGSFWIELDEVVSAGIPDDGAGVLEVPGSADWYYFEGTAGQRLVLEDLTGTGCCSVSIIIRDPDWNELLWDSLYGADPRLITLPMDGTYSVQVLSEDRGQPYVGDYSFALRTVPGPEEFDLGDLTETREVWEGNPEAGAGVLDGPYAEDVFLFTANAGDAVVFRDLGWYNIDENWANVEWILVAPSGEQIFQRWMDGWGLGVRILPETGQYRLRIRNEGVGSVIYEFNLEPAPAPQVFQIAIGDLIEPDDETGMGIIGQDWAVQVYEFEGTDGQEIYIDDLGMEDGCCLVYSLIGPDGALLIEDDWIDGWDIGRILLWESGVHRLIVRSSDSGSPYTGRFRIGVLPMVREEFAIELDSPVSVGVPESGAGHIDLVNESDEYLFTGVVGQVIYVDRLTEAQDNLEWRLSAPNGGIVFHGWFNNHDPGRIVLTQAGEYRLSVHPNPNWGGSGTDYSFVVRTVTDDPVFAIGIGDTVSDGVPAVGAGNIAMPGQVDRYTLQLVAGDVFFVADLGSVNSALQLQLMSPGGGTWVTDTLNGVGTRRFVVPSSGTWEIRVGTYWWNPDATGTYSFGVLPVSDDGPMALTLPAVIGDGVPAAGAGNIESPGSADIYTFAGVAGQVIYVDDRQTSGLGNFAVRIFAPSGTQIRYDALDGSDTGRLVLGETGGHRVEVQAVDNRVASIGTYDFALLTVVDQGPFALTLPATVSDGVPAAGAGNLEAFGSRDTYTFPGTAGSFLYFDDLGSASSGAWWYVYRPDGNLLFSDRLDGSDPGRWELPQSGQYRIEVWSSATPTAINGPYSFSVLPVQDDGPFNLSLGATVTPGSPAAGAGTIETAGGRDTYLLTVPSQQWLYFDDFAGQPGYPSSVMTLRLWHPDGYVVLTDTLDGNDRSYYAGLAGTYTITVTGNNNVGESGNYSFKVWGARPEIVTQPVSQSVASGATAEFGIVAASPFVPLTYQWFFGNAPVTGSDVQGAATATLRLSPAAVGRTGDFYCVVSNPYGATTSSVVTLTVTAADFLVSSLTPNVIASSLGQIEVQFSAPVDVGTLGTDDFKITGPGGIIDPAGFVLTSLGSDRYRLSFPPATAPGVYQIEVGPGIQGAEGQPMLPGAYAPIYVTDFEAGVDAFWDRTTTTTTATSTRFLGRYGNDRVTLTLPALPPHETIRVMWDGIIIDTWDGNATSSGPDYFGVEVDGPATPAWEYTFHSSNLANQTYNLTTPEVYGVNFAGSAQGDAIYRNMGFTTPHSAASLSLTFRGRNLQALADESWGIDNVRVLLPSAGDGTFRAAVLLDGQAPTVSSFTPSGVLTTPVTQLTLTFNEPVAASSIGVEDFGLIRPDGVAVVLSSVTRVNATQVQLNFPSQRMNGIHTLRVGPNLSDLAGNLMNEDGDGTPGESVEDRWEGTFEMRTPPQITQHPVSQTILRGSPVTFTVAAAATAPVTYQWQFNGADLEDENGSTLTLPAVQLVQGGTYRCLVTDAGGTTPSNGAVLTVQANYGTLIPLAQASRDTLPPVPGNGVSIELFNGVGGGAAPTPAFLSSRTPSGTTLSPFIDFPRPGNVISVGNSFNTFFQNTTTPPEQVLGLAASNFILRHRFHLRVTRSLDVAPGTPEIDIQLGVGSDDGFHLTVGGQVLGSAGDRGFTYTWMNVSFADEGLYPVELLFAANSTGQSGLEFSWRHQAVPGGEIIPQGSLYVTPDLGDRLITFEEVPAGSALTDQYVGEGVVFETISGSPVTTSANPGTFVPVSAPRVFGDPAAASEIEIRFVQPGTTTPATTPFVAFFLIDAAAPGSVIRAFNAAGTEIFTRTVQAGAGSQELISISAPGIARVRIALGSGSETAAIDNLAYLTPVALPDLVVSAVAGPPTAVSGAEMDVTYTVTNLGSVPAVGPWTDRVDLSSDATIGSDTVLGTFAVAGPLGPGESVMVTRRVTLPAGPSGNRWLVVTVDSGDAVVETGSLANNVGISAAPTEILMPDLVVDSVTTPPVATMGSSINVEWVIRNAGNVAAANWVDQLTLRLPAGGLVANLLTRPAGAAAPLAAGTSVTLSSTVTIPATGVVPGNYRVDVATDSTGLVVESNEGNNVGSGGTLQLVLPPRPDLAVENVVVPVSVTPGTPFTVSWTTRNLGTVVAVGPWVETVSISTDGVIGGDTVMVTVPVATPLAAGGSVERSATVLIPHDGVAGSFHAVVTADSAGQVSEESEANNAAISQFNFTVPHRLRLVASSAQTTEGGAPVTFTLTRNGDRSGALTVLLTASDAAGLAVPVSVEIPAGLASTTFAGTPLTDGVVDPDALVEVSAMAAGFTTGTAQVTVRNVDVPALVLALGNAEVREGLTVAATVSRPAAAPSPLTVNVSTPHPTQIIVPTTVVIPADAVSVVFTVIAAADTVIEPDLLSSVAVASAGYTGDSRPLTVIDDDLPDLSLVLNAASVSEGAGPNATFGTVTRSFSSDRALLVRLGSSDVTAATVPATLTIPAGQSSATFAVGAVDDGVVDGPQPVTVRAVILVGGIETGTAVEAGLVVTDDDGPTLTLSFNAATLPEGLAAAAVGTVRRNTDTGVPLEVALTVDVAGELVLPPTVLFAVGSATAVFPVGTVDDGEPDGAKRVTVTAGAAGFTSGSAQIVVSDINLPDLVISSVTGPATGETEAWVTGTYRVENRGLRAAGPFSVRLFVSADSVLSADDVLAAQFNFPAEFPAGSFFEVTPTFRLPRTTGTYRLIAHADANQVVTEIDESNNTAVSGPVLVQSAYSVTVATDVEVAPAGTVIPMVGRAILNNGVPAPSVLVNIHIVTRGTRRVISALTDSAGNFRANFTPLPGEAGRYEIAASHPGVAEPGAQDGFVLLGLRVRAPGGLSVIEGGSASGSTQVENLSELVLNGVAVEVLSSPAGLNVTANLSGGVLAGNDTLTLGYAVTAPMGVHQGGTARFRITTAEGPGATVDLPIRVDVLRPRLVATPGEIVTGMRRGTQVSLAFEVANLGGLETGPLRVLLPPLPWLSSASGGELASLAPGESAGVSLLLTPPADLPLGPYQGSIVIASENSRVIVPFTFRCLSDSIGGMRVEVTDEYTFYAEGSPRVANASIRLLDGFTGVTVLETNSGASGIVEIPNLPENYYRVEISAAQHGSYSQVHLVAAGVTTDVVAFISRQAVRYTWTVEPTQIEDRTKIVIETVFETAVPLPVVTIEPASVDLAEIVGPEGQVNFRITNHGLIAAKNSRLEVPSHPGWIFEPLISEFGDLPAKTSLTVPMTIRRAGTAGGGAAIRRAAAVAAGGGPCITAGLTTYELVCGDQTNRYTVPYVMYNAGAGCGGTGGSTVPRLDFRGEPGGGPGPGGGVGPCFLCTVPYYGVPITPQSKPEGCDPCKLNLGIGIAECIVDQLANKFPLIKVLNCMYALSKCGGKISGSGVIGGGLSLDCLNTVTSCSPIEIPGLSEFSCIRGLLCACVNSSSSGLLQCACQITDTPFTRDTVDKCGGGGGSGGSGGGAVARRGAATASGPDHEQAYLRLNPLPPLPANVPELAELRIRADRLGRVMAPMIYILDDEAWVGANAADPANIQFWATFSERSAAGSADEHLLTPAELDELRALPLPGVPTASVEKFLLRWNRTVGYRRQEITNWTDLPAGWDEDFIADDVLGGLLADAAAAREENLADGFNDEYTAVKDARDRLNNQLLNGGGVCARVKLRLEQEAVITRDAFKATLEVENNTAGPLEFVSVELRVEREDGSESTVDFGIRTPQLSGIGAVDGTGTIGAQSTGRASWILVPTSDAAPTGPVEHYVSGTLRYRQDGVIITVPLAPSRIEVLPNPKLVVQYFHQRDVFADDPFTDPIEPSIPYSLAVLVRNDGFGIARNFRIISGQPQIVENEKGLLIDFKLIATEVAGRNLTPSLTANFGDVGPGQLVIGRWLFTSSLQGNFREYTASFAHQDELGDPRLSLIDDVTIHEMIRLVEVGAPFDDGKPDFLVNDIGDPRNMPDTLYLSDGTTNAVSVVELAAVNGIPGGGVTQVGILADMPAGWTYLRIPEPSAGGLRLHRVVRSDGVELRLDRQFWVTDRTFPGLGARPIYESMLHLLDYNSTGQYTLFYVEPPAPDLTPPVSAVSALPASSPAQFPVAWSGSDVGSGIGGYDIYVSDNGSPFAAWITGTPLTGAVYTGQVGRTYAFYSRARDNAGNVEAPPAEADASTTVAFVSSAPTLSVIPDQTTPSGVGVSGIAFTVSDPDTALNELLLNVASSNPGLIPSASVQILGDGAARTLSFVPTAGQAGNAVLTVTVSDGSASASRSFLVTVTSLNQSPVAGPDVIHRNPGTDVKVAIVDLLANDTDPDFDTVVFAGVSPVSANGGVVRRSGPWILYTPPPGSNASDSFTYQVSDGRGGTGIGLVQIQVSGGDTTPSRNVLTLVPGPGGRMTIRFAGIPGRTYRIETASDLTAPVWTFLGTAQAGANGLFEFTDNDGGQASRYYRSVEPATP